MSQWDKLIKRIHNLSKDLRFEELQKVLEVYGYELKLPRSAAVMLHLGKRAVSRLRYQNMNQ